MRREGRYCRKCGYDCVTQLELGAERCPECGTAVGRGVCLPRPPSWARRHAGLVVAVCVPVFLLSVAVSAVMLLIRPGWLAPHLSRALIVAVAAGGFALFVMAYVIGLRCLLSDRKKNGTVGLNLGVALAFLVYLIVAVLVGLR
ncbi:MAG TPA: hypothetical protein VG797_05130 [Phycisphaerales bacterium]|nr:hypothetical protein [Phycisphaerales bacterium]